MRQSFSLAGENGGLVPSLFSARPVKLRTVNLTHLAPSASASPPVPARVTKCTTECVAGSPCHSLETSATAAREAQRRPADGPSLLTAPDPFLRHRCAPLPHSVAPVTTHGGGGGQEEEDALHGGVSGPEDHTHRSGNIRKWQAFGLNTARYVASPAADSGGSSCHDTRHAAVAAVRDARAIDVDIADVDNDSDVGEDVFDLAHDVPSAGQTTAATCAGKCNESSSLAQLRRQLSELSNRVNDAAERARCGPVRTRSGGSGGAPQKRRRSAVGKHARAQRKTSRREADSQNKAAHDRVEEETKAGEEEELHTQSSAADANTERLAGGTRAKGRCPPRGRQRAAAAGSSPSFSKGDGKRAPRATAGQRRATAGAAATGMPPHPLFPFTNSLPAPLVPSGTAAASRAADSRAPGLSGAAAAAAPIDCVPLTTQAEVDALFADLRAALDDPDRIQAPPLFLGLHMRGHETNASLSSSSRGKSFLPIAAGHDPWRAHHCVTDVVLRWKDSVYALRAEPHGLAFVCRVLEDLAGVEVITFHAPAVLLPLLARTGGRLATACVSDVRVMGWMAALAVSDGEAAAGDAPAAAVGGGGAGVETYCDLSVLFDRYGGSCSGSVLGPPLLPFSAHNGDADGAATMDARACKLLEEAALQRLAREVFYLAPLYRSLYGLLGARGMLQAFLRQEKRVPLLLAMMKLEGVCVDMTEVQRFREHCQAEMEACAAKAKAFVPQLATFNIQSPDQVRTAIYDVLQLGKHLAADRADGGQADFTSTTLPHLGAGPTDSDAHTALLATAAPITKGGKLSTAEETLRALARVHAFPAHVMRYRKFAKVLQTYVEGIVSHAIPPRPDGRPNSGRWAHAATQQTGNGAAPMQEPTHTAVDSGDAARQRSPADADFEDVALLPPSDGPSDADGITGHHRRAVGRDNGDEESLTPSVAGVSGGGTEPLHCTSTSVDGRGLHPSNAVTSAGAGRPPDSGDERKLVSLHPNFLQEGTDTGRLSCVGPNLQSLPRTALQPTAGAVAAPSSPDEAANASEELAFRRCFVAPRGAVLLSVDYQQIELRVLAHLCGDPALLRALTSGHADIHRAVAEVVFRKCPVSAEERNLSKRVVFGVLYGAGPRTLAAQMGVSIDRALHVSSLLRNAFPQIDVFHRQTVQQGREDGFVRTLSGRLRCLPDLRSAVLGKRAYAERQAFNTVVQGSAADVMKAAMLAVERDVLQPMRDDVRLVMQIHDEMVFVVSRERLSEAVAGVTRSMSRAMSLLVPLTVTAKFGPSLGELQEWSVDHALGIASEV